MRTMVEGETPLETLPIPTLPVQGGTELGRMTA